ncbi:hypothetical protein TbgDal_II1810 [Trypanosoma brucei gambiense DAL972]|uniref:Uncharacterized protein n=1 Tax=Trypanosoma brucei gambiense (strain MHOM/CI/86/DAL972) TaxID=679716 RepID=C9ZJ86_TRYB9|nr:hypothetical protein TbgDal_II1810 [Trypanosoma brucei gambiense DAL972]CBH09445.1 hypothetical protein TbgDal_II1810 [Trypanosoma brucei gambiense DAL972]|eukprot:XP_011771750.1 hypothetical protein TbgDal_II1810 [Trypanosoma brucei gambiense DAL972]
MSGLAERTLSRPKTNRTQCVSGGLSSWEKTRNNIRPRIDFQALFLFLFCCNDPTATLGLAHGTNECANYTRPLAHSANKRFPNFRNHMQEFRHPSEKKKENGPRQASKQCSWGIHHRISGCDISGVRNSFASRKPQRPEKTNARCGSQMSEKAINLPCAGTESCKEELCLAADALLTERAEGF